MDAATSQVRFKLWCYSGLQSFNEELELWINTAMATSHYCREQSTRGCILLMLKTEQNVKWKKPTCCFTVSNQGLSKCNKNLFNIMKKYNLTCQNLVFCLALQWSFDKFEITLMSPGLFYSHLLYKSGFFQLGLE